jgi:hypothetical protein
MAALAPQGALGMARQSVGELRHGVAIAAE